MPTLDVSKLDLRDALDLAILIEEEARQRYEWFTHLAGGRYPGDASDAFRIMAQNEAKHGRALAARREQLYLGAPRRMTLEMLDDVEAPDRGQPRVFMSPREALEVALDSEVKAHDFFDRAAQAVADPEVRALFEELRQEELQHQRFIREKMKGLPPGPDLDEEDADEPGSDPGN